MNTTISRDVIASALLILAHKFPRLETVPVEFHAQWWRMYLQMIGDICNTAQTDDNKKDTP